VVQLDEALAFLRRAMERHGVPPWRAPESTEGLDRLAAALAPLRLPAELRRFWTLVDASTLLVAPSGVQVIWPKAALEDWRWMGEDFPDMQPRVLLTFAVESQHRYSVELTVGDADGGAIFEWWVGDQTFKRRFNGLAGWLEAVAALLHRGHYERFDNEFGSRWEVPDYGDAEAAAALRSPPGPHPVHGTLLEIQGGIKDWPKHWQLASGIRDEDLLPRGATHTIAELLASPPEAPLRATIAAQVTAVAGSGARWARVRVQDATGTLSVLCPPETTMLGPCWGMWYEFDVALEAGPRRRPADPDAASAGIEDLAEQFAAVLKAKYFGPAGATAVAIRPIPNRP
jgi:hypothetical protein